MTPTHKETLSKQRIDKWLWAARFYKTRSLASDAIDKGQVRINEAPVKPAREVKPGDQVAVRIGPVIRTVDVKALSPSRGGAPQAALLYEETQASKNIREAAAENRRLAPEPALDYTDGRPTKRDRRELNQVQDWDNRWSARAQD
jgi:ribosome-associated heat shock protein Hsp15